MPSSRNKNPDGRNLLLVDGHHFLFRSYGVPFKFSSKKGTPLHVLTGFLKNLRSAITLTQWQFGKVDAICVIFDSQQKTENHDLLPEYKQNRKYEYKEEEDSPFHHLPHIFTMLQKLSIFNKLGEGYEADDLIATLSENFIAADATNNVMIASNDSDFYQLLSSRVNQVLFKRGGKSEIVDDSYVQEEIGVSVSEYILYKSIKGDPTDNIKGIPGIGKVRAAQIINKELAFDLEPYKEVLELNKKLISLNRAVKIRVVKPRSLKFNDSIMKLSNREIFELCEF